MKTAPIVALLCALSTVACARATSNVYRKTLKEPTVVTGYPCAKGYAWFYPGDTLKSCFLARDAAFGEVRVPAGSYITLTADGKPRVVQLAHDARLSEYSVRGAGLLGPSTGPMASFYPSGRLHEIYLVGNQSIQGVPCRGGQGGILTDPVNGGNFVELYENGKLRGCKLTQDYNGLRSGHRITLAP